MGWSCNGKHVSLCSVVVDRTDDYVGNADNRWFLVWRKKFQMADPMTLCCWTNSSWCSCYSAFGSSLSSWIAFPHPENNKQVLPFHSLGAPNRTCPLSSALNWRLVRNKRSFFSREQNTCFQQCATTRRITCVSVPRTDDRSLTTRIQKSELPPKGLFIFAPDTNETTVGRAKGAKGSQKPYLEIW